MPIQDSVKTKAKPLVVLYGPPGVGKLTVAKELQRITDLPLFHNHLTLDLAKSVFKNQNSVELIDKLRLDFFEFAAKNNSGLIFTFVYAAKSDDNFMNSLVEIAKKYEVEIYFVQLLCQVNAWKQRLADRQRLEYNKVLDFTLVKKTMQNVDLLSPYIAAKNHQIIDITDLSPNQTARIILEFINF